MEAGSSKSENKERCQHRHPVQRATMANQHSASIHLPLPFMLFGILSLVAASAWMMYSPELLLSSYRMPPTIALVHTVVLGFVLSTVMGAMYQLVPVALETQLHSVKLAWWHLASHVVGVTGMIFSFLKWEMGSVGHFGSFVALGVILFVLNIAKTLRKIPVPTVVAAFVAISLFWLSVTLILGLTLAADKHWHFIPDRPLSLLQAHAHLGIIGIFLTLMVGVSFRLIPMFALTEIQSLARCWWTFLFLSAGLLGLFWAIAFQFSQARLIFGGVLLVGLLVYGLEIIAMLRARKRRGFDWGLRYFLTSLALIIPTACLGIGTITPVVTEEPLPMETAYAFSAIIGVVTFGILGMLYKIIPFLVWFYSYSPKVGRARVPALADLYSHSVQAFEYSLHVGGVAFVTSGLILHSTFLFKTGAFLWMGAILSFVFNVGLILRHWIDPRWEPLSFGKPQSPGVSA